MIMQVQPQTDPVQSLTSTPVTSPFKPNSPPKLVYLVGGIATILVSVALAIVFFGSRGTAAPQTTRPSDTTAVTADPAWPKFANPTYFYEIALPIKWVNIKRSPIILDTMLFDVEAVAILEINASKTTMSLDEYLSQFDATNKDLVKPKSSSPIKVGLYDGYERAETWPSSGLQVITSYVKVSDMLYTFTLIPSAGKNAITNESILRDYRSSLSSFMITDTAQLGVDLKDYQSKKIENLAFSAFTLKYPQSWVLSEKAGDNTLDVSIYRNNYEITISQKSIGKAVCLFSDSPSFEGSSGDLRSKQFSEFETIAGTTLRRYFNANSGDKSTMFFCEKQKEGPYFETPLTIGGLVYYVPAKYDADIIKEMDAIIKSITIVQ